MRTSKQSLRIFALTAALASIAGPLSASAAEEPASPQTQQVTSVRVDGIVYSPEQFEQRFTTQSLHWVDDPEAEAQGLLIAFTTEEKRDAALGLDKPEGQRLSARPSAASAPLFPMVNKHDSYHGPSVQVRENKASLGSFNDEASSVETFDFGLTLYEHTNYRGCSLFLRPNTNISDLDDRRRCSINPFKTWNDNVSSIKLIQ
jgi:hypothetical protein